MNDFWIYSQLGFDHITDPNGYDHILFVVALCAVYSVRQWRPVLVLITAFTIGHSITLALATMRLLTVRTDVVECLIPITILITAVANFFYQITNHTSPQPTRLPLETKSPATNLPLRDSLKGWLGVDARYPLALCFGLIHGLGFSNYLRSLLGREADIIVPLLAFNIGLELGQVLIVSAVLSVSYVAVDWARVARRDWIWVISALVAFMAISLILTSDLVAGK